MNFIDYLKAIFLYRPYSWNGVFSPLVFCLALRALFIEGKPTRKRLILYLGNVGLFYILYILTSYFSLFAPFPVTTILIRFLAPFLLCLFQFFIQLLAKKDRYTLLVTLLTFMTCVIGSDELTNIIGQVFNLWDSALVLTIVFDLFAFGLCRFLVPASFKNPDIVHIGLHIIVDLGALLAIGAVEYIFNNGYRYTLSVPLLLGSIGIYLATISSYVLYVKVTREKERDIERQGIFFKKYTGETMTRLTEENIEENRKLRHDLKAQYQLIGYYIDKKDYDALRKYCSEMENETFTTLHFIDCGNVAISGVVNLEMRKARSKDLVLNHDIVVPRKLSLSDYDITHLVFNLLDNAIEAVDREKPEDKTIDLSIVLKNTILTICVKNAIRDGNHDSEQTSKEDKNFHGYGIKIVKQIVKKNNGLYNKKVTDREYLVEVGIPCREINEKEVDNP